MYKANYDPTMCYLPETYFRSKDISRVTVKEWKRTFFANSNQNRAEVVILSSGKINFKSKSLLKRQRMTLYIDKRVKSPR